MKCQDLTILTTSCPHVLIDSMILFAPEDRSTVYTIDSEGTLYFAPIYSDDTIDFNEFNEYQPLDELDDEDMQMIQEKLITMMKSIGEYFKK
jgi:hypothetical protein